MNNPADRRVAKAPVRVLIVDDHGIVREGLRTLLAEEETIEVVGEAADGSQAVALASRLRPDLALMDLVMPGMDGLEALRRVRVTSPTTQVVVLTSFADDTRVRDAIAAGAIGYLLKDVLKDDILRAIENAMHGKPSLHPEAQRHLMRRVRREEPEPVEEPTPRDREILGLLGRGRATRPSPPASASPGDGQGLRERGAGEAGGRGPDAGGALRRQARAGAAERGQRRGARR